MAKDGGSATPAPIASRFSITSLIGLLTSQRDLYAQLAQLSLESQQHEPVTDAQAIAAQLLKRQELIDQLTGLDAQLHAYRQRWVEVWEQHCSQENRLQIRGLLTQIQGYVTSVQDRDEACRQQLTQAKNQLGAQLARLTRASEVKQAYQSFPQHSNRFTNRQG